MTQLRRVWIGSPNYSSRGGSGVRLVVVHTAEGARNFRDLGGFFASSSAAASSHTGIDDEQGTIGEYVVRSNKAWTQANYNPQCVSTELCAAPIASSHPCGANWDAEEWNRHTAMLSNVADWIREECDYYGLPVTKLSAADAQGSGRGVCGHADLGAGGGGHWDPGPHFPWSRVMDMARGTTTQPPPAAALEQEDPSMIALGQMKDGRFELFVEAQPNKPGQAGEVFHIWNAKEGGWSGAEKGKRNAYWESLGTPGQQG